MGQESGAACAQLQPQQAICVPQPNATFVAFFCSSGHRAEPDAPATVGGKRKVGKGKAKQG